MTARSRRAQLASAVLGIALAMVSLAGGGTSSKIEPFRAMDDGATTIADLRARPIRLPHLARDAACPTRAPETVTGGAGPGVHVGPVTAVLGRPDGVMSFQRGSGAWASGKILWLVESGQPALLVRGRRLDGGGGVRWRADNGSTKELVLDQDATSTVGPEWRDQPSGPRVKSAGCYGVQVDGPDFQAVIVFRAEVLGAYATKHTRSVDVRDLRLARGETLQISLHPSDVPIEIDSSAPEVEVCPHGWPSFTGFSDCLPVDADGHLTLPSTKSSSFHLGFIVQGIDKAAGRISRVTITYELEDGFFMVLLPSLGPGAGSASIVVTPIERTSVAVGPYVPGKNTFDSHLQAVLHQGAKRIRRGGIATGRDEPSYGPVALEKPVEVRLNNTGTSTALVDLLVDWN